MLKQLRSYFLQLRAAACQGRRQFDRVVALLSEANRLTPNNPIILVLLADAYHRQGRHDDSLNALQQGLALDSENSFLNRLMVDVLVDSDAPVEQLIPHIKAVLRNRTGGDSFPKWMQRFQRFKEMEDYHDKWIAWAEKTLLDYETGKR